MDVSWNFFRWGGKEFQSIQECTAGHSKVTTLFFDGFQNAACLLSDWFLFMDPQIKMLLCAFGCTVHQSE